MITQLYTIYDSKAHVYNAPISIPNQAIAERSFAIAANDPTSFIGQSPTDYSLFLLGTYDDELAKFDLLPAPHCINLATAYIKKEPTA